MSKTASATKIPSISDVLPKEEFYPELDRAEWSALLDCTIVISDAKIITVDGDYGEHKAALVKYCLQDDVEKFYTTITSGQVIVDKMAKLVEKQLFPVTANVCRCNSKIKGRSPYYDLV